MSDTLCLEPPFGRLRDNVRCSSWANRKAHSGLPILVLTGLFFAGCYGGGATGENTKIRKYENTKIGVLKADGSVCVKFSRRRGRPPPIIFARIVRPMNTLQLYS